MNKIYTKDSLPPEGKYVIIHLTKDNWGDSSDPLGVYFKVSKLEKGITEEERQKMKDGILEDPDYQTLKWNEPTDTFRPSSCKRSSIIKAADVHGNNTVHIIGIRLDQEIILAKKLIIGCHCLLHYERN